jgi:hypothetical protein
MLWVKQCYIPTLTIFDFIWWYGGLNSGLTFARKVLCHLSHTFSLFLTLKRQFEKPQSSDNIKSVEAWGLSSVFSALRIYPGGFFVCFCFLKINLWYTLFCYLFLLNMDNSRFWLLDSHCCSNCVAFTLAPQWRPLHVICVAINIISSVSCSQASLNKPVCLPFLVFQSVMR